VSFVHGDPELGELFITKWHFVDKKDINAYRMSLDAAIDTSAEIGRLLFQKDIEKVEFRD